MIHKYVSIKTNGVDEVSVFTAWDLFPTLCAQAGAALPKNYESDGEDFSKAWRGQSVTRTKPLFWEYGRNTNSFAFPGGANRSPTVALRDGNWKLLLKAARAVRYGPARLRREHPDPQSRPEGPESCSHYFFGKCAQ